MSYLRLFFIFLFIFSCAHYSAIHPKGESLEQAFCKYWNYIKEGDFKSAFYYENISLTNKMSLEEYVQKSRSQLPIKEFSIISIGKNGPYGSIPIKMRLVTPWPKLPFPTPKGDLIREFEDYWIKRKGNWYHLRPGVGRLW